MGPSSKGSAKAVQKECVILRSRGIIHDDTTNFELDNTGTPSGAAAGSRQLLVSPSDAKFGVSSDDTALIFTYTDATSSGSDGFNPEFHDSSASSSLLVSAGVFLVALAFW